MLLGKRPRPPIMKRTTSMSGGMAVVDNMQVSNNLEFHEEVVVLVSDNSLHQQVEEDDAIKDPPHVLVADQTKDVLVGMVVMPPSSPTTTNINHPQNQTTNPAAHVIHTPHFLRTCGLCKCHLAPGRDIYMYRGDTAFCSLECREQQIKQDQRKEKWKVASNNEGHRAPPLTATAKASTKSETAACT